MAMRRGASRLSRPTVLSGSPQRDPSIHRRASRLARASCRTPRAELTSSAISGLRRVLRRALSPQVPDAPSSFNAKAATVLAAAQAWNAVPVKPCRCPAALARRTSIATPPPSATILEPALSPARSAPIATAIDGAPSASLASHRADRTEQEPAPRSLAPGPRAIRTTQARSATTSLAFVATRPAGAGPPFRSPRLRPSANPVAPGDATARAGASRRKAFAWRSWGRVRFAPRALLARLRPDVSATSARYRTR
jgi:hypothetical protein